MCSSDLAVLKGRTDVYQQREADRAERGGGRGRDGNERRGKMSRNILSIGEMGRVREEK